MKLDSYFKGTVLQPLAHRRPQWLRQRNEIQHFYDSSSVDKAARRAESGRCDFEFTLSYSVRMGRIDGWIAHNHSTLNGWRGGHLFLGRETVALNLIELLQVAASIGDSWMDGRGLNLFPVKAGWEGGRVRTR